MKTKIKVTKNTRLILFSIFSISAIVAITIAIYCGLHQYNIGFYLGIGWCIFILALGFLYSQITEEI